MSPFKSSLVILLLLVPLIFAQSNSTDPGLHFCQSCTVGSKNCNTANSNCFQLPANNCTKLNLMCATSTYYGNLVAQGSGNYQLNVYSTSDCSGTAGSTNSALGGTFRCIEVYGTWMYVTSSASYVVLSAASAFIALVLLL